VAQLLYPSVDLRLTGAGGLTLLTMAFMQRIVGFNRWVPWPVHFTSRVTGWGKIHLGKRVWPGFSAGCYIQARNGIRFGNNIRIAVNVGIISANHVMDDYDQAETGPPILVGNNVWIGMGVVVLPGVSICDNVVIGAGSIVTHDIPANCVAAGNPCRVLHPKEPYRGNTFIDS
jgi:acetyltransferase-like isoleucine patch superfamily enzyme